MARSDLVGRSPGCHGSVTAPGPVGGPVQGEDGPKIWYAPYKQLQGVK